MLTLLLTSLSSSLKLPSSTSLVELHRGNAPSPDILRLLHYLSQPPSETSAPQAPHTDIGSLTLLFTKMPGLQVLPPNSSEWTFVNPKEGCAIVNIGDGTCRNRRIFVFLKPTSINASPDAQGLMLGTYISLAMFTGGLFHSCLHRAGSPPRRAMGGRYLRISATYRGQCDDRSLTWYCGSH